MSNLDNKAEIEYALHTLLHIVRSASQGEYKIAKKLGLTDDNINELLTLNHQELHDLAAITKANFVKIEFDSEALVVALKINEANSQRRQQIQAMLKAGASYPVMQHFYGLTYDEMANFKKMLHLPSGEGRPAEPTASEDEQLWEILKPVDNLDTETLPDLLLTASKETEVPISSIWISLNKWCKQNNEDLVGI